MGLPPSTGSKASTRRATGQPLTSPLSTRVPIVVAEHWTLGEYGGGEAVYHFMHGDLLRYRSRTRGLSNAGAPSDGWYERTMTLYFEPGRFVGGTGHDQRQAGRAGRARGARRLAWGRGGQGTHRRARAAGAATVDPNRARYACTDGAAFAVTFDVAGARAIEFLGASRSFCRASKSAPASSTPMTDTGCAGGRRGALGGRRPRPGSLYARGKFDTAAPGAGQLPAVRPAARRQTTGRAFCST